MQPEGEDASYLWDMLEAGREALEFFQGAELQQFLNNRGLQLIVERELEIIGEAARRVSASFCDDHPEIPWHEIVGQRNVLAHDYGDIDQELVWKVMTEELPYLVRQLTDLLPSPRG